MAEGRKVEDIRSKVLGVAYTDLVCYILPGGLVLGVALFLLDREDDVFYLLSSTSTMGNIVLAFVILGASYLAGATLSFIRWFGYTLIEDRFKTVSLGRLLCGRVSPIILRRVNIPDTVLTEARRRIGEKLKELKHEGEPKETSKERKKEPDMPTERQIDHFWLLMMSAWRESGARTFAYYDRWSDIDVVRKNLIVAAQILLVVWAGSRLASCPSESWWTVLVAAIIVAALAWVYLCILPIQQYSNMRWLLLFYLSGDLKVGKGKEVSGN